MASWGEVSGAQYYNVIRVKTREIIEHKNKYGFGAVTCIESRTRQLDRHGHEVAVAERKVPVVAEVVSQLQG